MLLKLLKHDIKLLLNSCIGMYIIGILCSIIVRFFISSDIINFFNINKADFFLSIGFISIVLLNYYIASMPLFSFGAVSIKFYDTIFDKQGYLSHTLPVSSRELLLSKIISGYIILFISVVVSGISFAIFGLNIPLGEAIDYLIANLPFILTIGETIFLFLFPLFAIINAYFCIAVGHLTKYKKWGSTGVGVLLLIVYSIVLTNILSIYFNITNNNNPSFLLITLMLVLNYIYYNIIKKIIDNKLNLI